MRVLKFIVDKQLISADPKCDFSGLVPDTEKYLIAEFTFSSEWNGCNKVAAFYSFMGKEYPPQILSNGYSCAIPAEALERQRFKIQVIGKNKDGLKLVTNKVIVNQEGANT